MANKPVTVDLLHPTVVRAFTNWGYISFFGCIAALVTLLFFAIGQLKQADEARQQNAAPMESSSVADESTARQLVKPPFTYRNDNLGLTIDYSSLVAGVDAVYQHSYEPDGREGVGFLEEVKREGRRSLFGPKLQITWAQDSRSLDQYEVDERAQVARDYAGNLELVELDKLSVNGVDGLRMEYHDGECGGTIYTFFQDGYRIRIEAQCASDAAMSETLQTLHVE